MAASSDTASPKLPKEWKPPEVNDKNEVVKTLTKSFEQSLKGRDGLIGIAIVLAVVDSSAPAGTTVDINNVKSTFEKLNFGVWVVENPTAKQLAAVMHIATTHHYIFSTWCEGIVFYFAGHGGSFNGKEYVIPVRDGDPNPMYYIDEGIVYPFQPGYEARLGSRFRIFFFDCCRVQTKPTAEEPVSSKPLHSKPPSSLPPRGQCLIAYATSLHYVSSGSYSTGGIWTKHLCNNINKHANNKSISDILDMTYDDVVKETNLEGKTVDSETVVQGSEYKSSLGLFYLKAPFKRVEKEKEKTPSPSPSPSPVPDESESDDINIESIMDRLPEKNDLEAALKDMKDDVELWQNQFGKRLIKMGMIESETSLKNCLTLKFLIEYIYKEKPTWDEVIKALEEPYNIEVIVNRNEKIIVADSVRKYLCNAAVFLKYKKQKK